MARRVGAGREFEHPEAFFAYCRRVPERYYVCDQVTLVYRGEIQESDGRCELRFEMMEPIEGCWYARPVRVTVGEDGALHFQVVGLH